MWRSPGRRFLFAPVGAGWGMGDRVASGGKFGELLGGSGGARLGEKNFFLSAKFNKDTKQKNLQGIKK